MADWFDYLLYAFIFGLCIAILYGLLKRYITGKNARPYRELTEDEKIILEKYFDGPLKIKKNFLRYALFFVGGILLTFVILIFAGLLEEPYKQLLFSVGGAIGVTVLVGTVLTICILDKAYYISDLNSRVCRVEDKFMRVQSEIGPGKLYDFYIGKYGFWEQDILRGEYKDTIDNLQSNDLVAVEFSPKSKVIWKIEKIDNLN